jgi:thiamine biosynthesis lipoprotein
MRDVIAEPQLVSVAFPALGTTASLVVTRGSRLAIARRVLESELDEIDRACSRFRPDSDLTRVNAAPGRRVRVAPRLITAVEVAVRAARITDGDVDPTVGQALQLVGYDRDFDSVAPNGPPIQLEVGRIPGWRTVEVDRARLTVRVPRGVKLDLGATAKALAADQAADAVRDAVGGGVLVSLGGDLAAAGRAPAGGWCVRVTDDHAAHPCAAGETVIVASGGLATSSTTVRRWTRGDRELHHIIDPATGCSTESCWRTVSVAAATCVDANTASTAAIVRGESAPMWLASLNMPARLVRHDGSVIRVGGWATTERS